MTIEVEFLDTLERVMMMIDFDVWYKNDCETIFNLTDHEDRETVRRCLWPMLRIAAKHSPDDVKKIRVWRKLRKSSPKETLLSEWDVKWKDRVVDIELVKT